MNEALTEKQEALLDYIEQYQMANGGSPTLREMREHFGVSSDNSILKLLKSLEEKGKISREAGAKNIKLLSSVKAKLQKEEFSLPVLGHVPAGAPVYAQENIDTWLKVGEDLVYQNKTSFLLEVTGDSMIDAGIFAHDYVVVCTELTARPGDIVVALVDNQSTVKRLMSAANGQSYLKPENANYENIYPEHSFYIQGVVTGLIRYFRR